MPKHLIESKLADEVTTQRGTDTPVASSEKAPASKYNLTGGMTPHEQLKRQVEFRASTQDEA